MPINQDDSQNRTYSSPDNPTFIGQNFSNASSRRGAGQARYPDQLFYQRDTGTFWRLKPRLICFLSDGTTVATNRGTWGTIDLHWVQMVDVDMVSSLVPSLDYYDPFAVPTTKAKAVIAAYTSNSGPVLETDATYFGKDFTDDFTSPGDEFNYICKPRRPLNPGGATVWRWGRYQETGV